MDGRELQRLAGQLLPLLMQRIYDRGLWTPALEGETTPGDLDYTLQQGRYLRIAGLILVSAEIQIDTVAVAMAGNLRLTGLPFVVDAASIIGGVVVAGDYAYTAGSLELHIYPVVGESYAYLVEAADSAPPVTDIAGNIGDGTTLRVWLCYEADEADAPPVTGFNLLEYWTLDNTSDGYVGTVAGRTLTAVGAGVTTTAGIIANAFAKDTSDSYLVGDGVELTNSWAVGAWHYYGGTDYIITQWPDSAGLFEWGLDTYGTDGRVRFYVNDGGSPVTATGTSPGVLGEWRYIVGAYDVVTNEIRVYVNGVLEATEVVNAAPNTPGSVPFWVARRGTNTSTTAQHIDEIEMWEGASLSDPEPGVDFWFNRWNLGAGQRP